MNRYKENKRWNVKSLSTDYMDKIMAVQEPYDPFEKKEIEEKREMKKDKLETVRAIIANSVGIDNYIRYYLYRVSGLKSKTIGEYFGVKPNTIRKTAQRVKDRVIGMAVELSKQDILSIKDDNINPEELANTLASLTVELRSIENSQKRKVNGEEEVDCSFDLDKATEEYYRNMRKVEKECGLPINGRNY